jgi:Mn-dependent DtxR family transcriptional regulator
MTYLRDGQEYVDRDEQRVLAEIAYLSTSGRTTNNSQIARAVRFPTSKVARIVEGLRLRGYIKNVGKGQAYHWRLTDKGKTAKTEPRTERVAAAIDRAIEDADMAAERAAELKLFRQGRL